MLKYYTLTHDELLKLYNTDKNFKKFIEQYILEYAGKIRNITDNMKFLLYDKADYVTYAGDYFAIISKHKNIYASITFAIKINKLTKIFSTLPNKYINYWYIYAINATYKLIFLLI